MKTYENNSMIYDDGYVRRDPSVNPKGSIILKDMPNRDAIIDEYLTKICPTLYKEPKGVMRYPYVVPGGSYLDLWDWDSFFVSCAVPEEGIPYAKGSVLNFLEGPFELTGRPTKKISPDGSRDSYSFPYPLQAQFAYIIAKRVGDFSWIEPYWNNLKRMRQWYDENSKSKRGYYLWNKMYGNGIDNNPAVYGRPNFTVAGVDLASWHYRDMMAMYKLSKLFEPEVSQQYYEQAQALKLQIQSNYWDEMDKFFYNIDCSEDFSQKTLQEITWHIYLKFPNISTMFPLWAGIATKEQAKYMRDALMDENQFLSCCGIRSHSKRDPIYNNVMTVDPSNWQGPVWGLSSHLAMYGLQRYGYKDDAAEVAKRIANAFACDLEQNGVTHEYYHGDTGQPVFRPGFISWNVLALRAEKDIAAGTDCTTYDLLDE